MDRVLPPLLVSSAWEPKLKKYPHFDHAMSVPKIIELVTDPARVAANTFYPFLLYYQRWQPFRDADGGKPEKKKRPIRYASRRDAYIFAYYRHLLVAPYEALLRSLNIADCVSAYRKIRQASGAGKSNIEFAKDAFDAIATVGNAAVVAVDISGFFESLEHELLKRQWCRVLNVASLPPDHESVFRAITRYAVVDRDEAYKRLGLLKADLKTGKPVYERAPRKICSNADFRTKICGVGGSHKSLVRNNRKPYGIPQGSPISDILANIYMTDFDVTMNDYCVSRGGIYRRYSDDVLIVLPGGDAEALAARDFVVSEVSLHGSKLRIKDSKTAVLRYERATGGHQRFAHVAGQQGKNGLEYLGFRYDGKEVWLRDATLSRLYRKVSASVRAAVAALVKRYPGKGAAFLEASFDFGDFFQRYGRVKNFDQHADVEDWTFWTYARKARTVFGTRGRPISMQLRRYKEIVRGRVRDRIINTLP
jgi:hypothetical protein